MFLLLVILIFFPKYAFGMENQKGIKEFLSLKQEIITVFKATQKSKADFITEQGEIVKKIQLFEGQSEEKICLEELYNEKLDTFIEKAAEEWVFEGVKTVKRLEMEYNKFCAQVKTINNSVAPLQIANILLTCEQEVLLEILFNDKEVRQQYVKIYNTHKKSLETNGERHDIASVQKKYKEDLTQLFMKSQFLNNIRAMQNMCKDLWIDFFLLLVQNNMLLQILGEGSDIVEKHQEINKRYQALLKKNVDNQEQLQKIQKEYQAEMAQVYTDFNIKRYAQIGSKDSSLSQDQQKISNLETEISQLKNENKTFASKVDKLTLLVYSQTFIIFIVGLYDLLKKVKIIV